MTIVKRNGYDIEKYNVLTQDGYIISLFRMPKKNRKGVIYLQHPATSSAIIWVDKGNSSLGAFICNI